MDYEDELERITPYYPIPYRSGCTEHHEYEVSYRTPCGDFTGVNTLVDYTTPKGKRVEGYLLRTKWDTK